MSEQIYTSGMKGLAFEQRIARLFAAKGYDVSHDVKLIGRSGATHQIDVLARMENALHTSTIVIEAKAHQTSIDKERVLKLVHVVADLGADRGIIVTTNHFTPDAYKTAAGHNVDLWDRDQLSRLIGEIEVAAVEGAPPKSVRLVEHAIAPRVDLAAVRARCESALVKRAKGTFGFGKVIESLIEIRAIYYPYYEAGLDVLARESQKVGLFGRETIRKTIKTALTIDGPSGTIVAVTPTGLSYGLDWLAGLSNDERSVLRAVGSVTFNVHSLVGIGLSESRARKTISTLTSKGLLDVVRARPAVYRAARSLPTDPNATRSLSEVWTVEPYLESEIPKFDVAMREPSAVIETIQSVFPEVEVGEIRVVFYPYYYGVFRRSDGSLRTETVDAVTGSLAEKINDWLRVRMAISTSTETT